MKSKLVLVVLAGMLLTWGASAQMSEVPISAYRFSAGVDGGVTLMHGDLPNKLVSPVGKLSGDYRWKEYINFGMEIQFGTLASGIRGGAKAPDRPEANIYSRNISWGMYSKNVYQAIILKAKVFVGQFNQDRSSNANFYVDVPEGAEYYLNNIYVGVGIGYIRNSITDIVTVFPRDNTPIPGVVKSSSGILIPLDLGINIPLPVQALSGNFNYQLNISTTDGVDGYDIEGLSFDNDAFSVITIGLRYNFGELL